MFIGNGVTRIDVMRGTIPNNVKIVDGTIRMQHHRIGHLIVILPVENIAIPIRTEDFIKKNCSKECSMKLKDKIRKSVREDLYAEIDKAFQNKYHIKTETSFNIIAMRMITNRVDEKRFTKEQKTWLSAFVLGYLSALDKIDLFGASVKETKEGV